MNSSAHVDNKKKNILILVKVLRKDLNIHWLQKNCIQSTLLNKACLSLDYNGANSYLFVNGTEIVKFKAEDSEIATYPLCLGNISKDWSVYNMKKTD